MVTTIKGEKYLSLEECIEKLYNFTKGKVKLDKQHFVALIKTYKNQGIDFKTLKHKMHLRLDVFETLMMGENRYDFINRAMNLYDKQIGYKEQVVSEPNYNNDENDMEQYSNNLINKYQFENRKIVRVNESQLNRLIENFTDEGATYRNNNGIINFSVDSKSSDIDNKAIDTRIFGTKHDILHGDGTITNGHVKSFNDLYTDNLNKINFYKSLINYVNNGFKGDLDFSILTSNVASKVQEMIKNGDKEGLLNFATTSLNRLEPNNLMDRNLYDKTYSLKNDNDRIERYRLGVVPGTNVNVISLFTMNDFNFSDALKHGELRQNGNTDKLLGISDSQRERIPSYGKVGSLKKLPVRYDNNLRPHIGQNFSLYNVRDGHSKQQYQYQGGRYNTSELSATDLQRELSKTKNYTSINQFLDKSIIYASYALKKEDFIPDYIVAAPSSSEFNHYYCINLSKKIGVPYLKDFFKRNLINVKFDASVEQEMIKDGISERERLDLETNIRKMALQEISCEVYKPIGLFFEQYKRVLSNISLKKMSREKCDIELLKDILCKLIITSLDETKVFKRTDNVYKLIVKTIYNNVSALKKNKVYDINHISNEMINRINTKIGKGVFTKLISDVDNLILYYNGLFNSGYELKLRNKRFKITDFDKRHRKYLKNVYIISDKYLNKDSELFTRFKSAKFVIFDEDINSGATLKLTIEALKMKVNNSDNNIICLVNAYSSSGR